MSSLIHKYLDFTKTSIMNSFVIRRLFLTILYTVNHIILAKSNGLTPFIQDFKPHRPLSLNSSSNVQHLQQQNKVMRQILYRQDEYRFVAKLGIGTSKTKRPLQVYFLHLDTGSPLSWLQCEGCKKCFIQTPKPYPKNKSLSYHPIASSSDQCLTKLSDGRHCSYKLTYNRTSYTSGILAKETFFIHSSRNKKKLENVVFGCGLDQSDLFYGLLSTNKIAGVLGLGRGPLSFLSQIDSISNGKFSYCLPHFDETRGILGDIRITYLRFGADAMSPRKIKMMRTKLLQIQGSPFYYVEMDGISFNHQRLKIDPNVFQIPKNNGEGGVIISSGSRYTQLATPAYNVLIKELDSYFSKMKYKKEIWQTGAENFRDIVAYVNKKVKHHILPSITFHFRGADLVVKPEALFKREPNDGLVKVGVLPSEKMTVIGAFQQIDHWIIYDTKKNVLSFHQENCRLLYN